jgi:hypothetical protein
MGIPYDYVWRAIIIICEMLLCRVEIAGAQVRGIFTYLFEFNGSKESNERTQGVL